MAQCCEDASCLFRDNFEDAPSLSMNYGPYGVGPDATPFQMALSSGDGVNGSICAEPTDAVEADGFFSRIFVAGDDFTQDSAGRFKALDTCGKKRLQFAVGCYLDFTKRLSFTSSVFEIRAHHDGATEVFLALNVADAADYDAGASTGRDLVVVDSDEKIVLTAYNVIDTVNFPFMQIELRGAIASESPDSTVSGGYNSNDDGWCELRVNGTTISNGDDLSTVQTEAAAVVPCPPAAGFKFWHLSTGAGDYRGGWNKIFWQPQGRIDCIYVRETADFCFEGPETKVGAGGQCPGPGPGGADFKGTPQGARFVHPGGI